MKELVDIIIGYYPDSFDTTELQEICKFVHVPLFLLLQETLEMVLNIIKMLRDKSDLECHLPSISIESSIQKCDSVLDYTWEQFHTGTWKDVAVEWRKVYSYASLSKAFFIAHLPGDDFRACGKEVVKVCDLGLIMGAPILGNILADVASAVSSILAQCTTPETTKRPKLDHRCSSNEIALNPAFKVEEFDCPSVETFLLEILPHKAPVLMKNAMDFWPALKKWDLEYIRKIAGFRTVPVELGSKYTDNTWSQTLMTINDFIDKYILLEKDNQKAYLAQYQLFDQIPQLQNDVVIPDYCYVGDSDEVQVNAWFGPKGTVSPLHQDPDHNFLCQVVGEKYVRLYAEDQSENLYPHEGMLSNTSQVDVENPDLERYPLFAKAPYWECILSEGSMLYIPPRVWHYVRSLSQSFSVSFWWK